MKKITTISLLFALSSLFAGPYDDIKTLNSDDVNLAQNGRIVAEKSEGAEATLLNALKSEKNQLAKDGIIYSLAKIKSEKAFPQIVELAKKGDKTAILALINYGDKASAVLQDLAKTNALAKDAEFLASSKYLNPKPATLEEFSKADEKAKIAILATLPATEASLDFLGKVKGIDPLVVMTSYSRIGGNAAAKKIMQLQADNKLDISVSSQSLAILAACKNASDALIEAAKAENLLAIRAIKEQCLAVAEDALLALTKSSNEEVKKEAFEAIATCGGVKSMDFFTDTITTAESKDLVLYVKVANAVYRTLAKDVAAKYKASLEGKAKSADARVKAAIEKIVAEPVSKKGKKKQ